MFSFFTLPSPSTVLATTTEWSDPFFTALTPFALAIAGILIGALLVQLLYGGILGAFDSLVNGFGGPMEKEYQRGKRKGYWSSREEYLND